MKNFYDLTSKLNENYEFDNTSRMIDAEFSNGYLRLDHGDDPKAVLARIDKMVKSHLNDLKFMLNQA